MDQECESKSAQGLSVTMISETMVSDSLSQGSCAKDSDNDCIHVKELCDLYNLVQDSKMKDPEKVSSIVRALIQDMVANLGYFFNEPFTGRQQFMDKKQRALNDKVGDFSAKYGKLGKMGIYVLAINGSTDPFFFREFLEKEIKGQPIMYISLMNVIVDILHQGLPEELRWMKLSKEQQKDNAKKVDLKSQWYNMYMTTKNITKIKIFVSKLSKLQPIELK